MAAKLINLITEKMRNPLNDSWIPLRQVVKNSSGKIKALQLDPDSGKPLDYTFADSNITGTNNGNDENSYFIPIPIGYRQGEITPVENTYILQAGQPVDIRDFLMVEDGIIRQMDRKTALSKIGISWGVDPAPEEGEPNTIYIQLIEEEQEETTE